MAVNDIYLAEFFMNVDDREPSVSMAYRETTVSSLDPAATAENLSAVAQEAFWTDFWQAKMSDECSYSRTKCQKIYPLRDAPAFLYSAQGQAGSAIGPPMNGTTAVLISEYGQTWGAAHRGRMYIPGIREEDADAGRLLSAKLTAIDIAAEAFLTAALDLTSPATGQFYPTVYSPTNVKWNKDNPTEPPRIIDSLMETYVVRARIATQRRRRTNVTSPS